MGSQIQKTTKQNSIGDAKVITFIQLAMNVKQMRSELEKCLMKKKSSLTAEWQKSS